MIRAWAVAIVFAAQSVLLAAGPVCQCNDLSRQATPVCSCPAHEASRDECCSTMSANHSGPDAGSAIAAPSVTLPSALPASVTTAAPPVDLHSASRSPRCRIHPLAAHVLSRAQRAPPA